MFLKVKSQLTATFLGVFLSFFGSGFRLVFGSFLPWVLSVLVGFEIWLLLLPMLDSGSLVFIVSGLVTVDFGSDTEVTFLRFPVLVVTFSFAVSWFLGSFIGGLCSLVFFGSCMQVFPFSGSGFSMTGFGSGAWVTVGWFPVLGSSGFVVSAGFFVWCLGSISNSFDSQVFSGSGSQVFFGSCLATIGFGFCAQVLIN